MGLGEAKGGLQKDTCERRQVSGCVGGGGSTKQILLENTIMMPNTLYANLKIDKWPERDVGGTPSAVSVLEWPSLPFS